MQRERRRRPPLAQSSARVPHPRRRRGIEQALVRPLACARRSAVSMRRGAGGDFQLSPRSRAARSSRCKRSASARSVSACTRRPARRSASFRGARFDVAKIGEDLFEAPHASSAACRVRSRSLRVSSVAPQRFEPFRNFAADISATRARQPRAARPATSASTGARAPPGARAPRHIRPRVWRRGCARSASCDAQFFELQARSDRVRAQAGDFGAERGSLCRLRRRALHLDVPPLWSALLAPLRRDAPARK